MQVYWQRRLWVRLSAQYYNTLDEYGRLVEALRALGAAGGQANGRVPGGGGMPSGEEPDGQVGDDYNDTVDDGDDEDDDDDDDDAFVLDERQALEA